MVVMELDPSSLLISVRHSAVRNLNSRTSERNGNRLVLAHVATCGYDSEMWSELQLLFATIELIDHLPTMTWIDHTATFLWLVLLSKVPQL